MPWVNPHKVQFADVWKFLTFKGSERTNLKKENKKIKMLNLQHRTLRNNAIQYKNTGHITYSDRKSDIIVFRKVVFIVLC